MKAADDSLSFRRKAKRIRSASPSRLESRLSFRCRQSKNPASSFRRFLMSLPDKKTSLSASAPLRRGTYGVTLTQRGKEFSFKRISLQAYQPTDVTFTVPKSLDGVIVATVYDDHKTPMAERLLFRQPENNLKVQVIADRTDYVPGDKVTLRIITTDETGKPVGAVVGLTVTDSSVLEMIEKREQAPRLPVMVLLENDVQESVRRPRLPGRKQPQGAARNRSSAGHTRLAPVLQCRNRGSSTVQSRMGAVRLFRGVTVRAMNTDTGVYSRTQHQ